MQKLGLSQNLQQKLSPQQIQFIKLLQVPTAELESRIEEEMEINPALEEGEDQEKPEESNDESESPESEIQDSASSDNDGEGDVDLKDYLGEEDYSGYKMQGDGDDGEDREMPIPMSSSLHELLMDQLEFLGLNEKEYAIGKQLVGSIESDGYIRRDLDAITNDMAFSQGIDTTEQEVEAVLKKIQTFDPAGIAARTLQECLLLQLERMDNGHDIDVAVTIKIITDCYDEFTKKHYQKIQKKLDTEDEDFVRDAMELIVKLNPKPGGGSVGSQGAKNQYIIPDYILTNNNGKLELALNSRNAPELRVSRSYIDMFKAYDKGNKKDKKLKEAVTFVKQKLDAAKWFID
ncbi:MAG TPA: RNA polymerase sigma-54 factor, partial [Chryseolinea sp.]|nr:RNA polymerase sigma-54 factor [Chryseolinea sp.]